jgi:serine phosphatase RsbU (regulator of sigma subunit)
MSARVFYISIFLSLLSLFSISGPLSASPPVIIEERTSELNLLPHLEILKDSRNRYSVEDLNRKEISDMFISSRGRYPLFPFSSAAYWIRFRVENRMEGDYNWRLEISNPLLNTIDIYQLDGTGRITVREKSGELQPFSRNKLNQRRFLFKFTEGAGKSQVYYIRVRTESFIYPSLTLYSAETFNKVNERNQVAQGIYFGALLVMIVYNLLIFISLRDRSYLYYVLYYLVSLLFNLSLSGLAFRYLWPESTWWVTKNLPAYMFMLIILGIQFSRSYLELSREIPEQDNLFKGIMIISGILIPASFFFEYPVMLRIGISMVIITIALIFLALYRIIRRKYRPARFLLFSLGFLCAGSLVYALKTVSVIPDNFFSRGAYQLASLLEVVTITLGLADRINYKKKESENMRIVLEKLVNQRTDELNTALKKMKLKDRELQIELNLAANIQDGILPETPYSVRGINIDAYLSAMGKVSGDFYDIFQMSGGYLGVVAADVSGHGMPAAFITAMAKINFSEAIQNNLFPADIFRQVNTELVNVIKTDDFLTAFFLVISPSFEIFYCNGSFLHPMLLRKDDLTIKKLDTNGLFLGSLLRANEMYEDGREQLEYGDRILLYSDGIIESRNRDGEIFGEKRLRLLFLQTSHQPVSDARKRIIDEWKKFTENREQTDDVSFLIIEIDPEYKNLIKYRDEGFRLLAMGKIKEAIDILELAVDIDGDDEKSHLYLGESYLKDRNYLKAVEHLNRYLKNNEIDANVWYHLAQAYFNLGNYTMANETALKAAKLRSDSADVLVLSGLSLRDLGLHQEAKKVWERLLLVEPNNQLAIMELEMINNSEKKDEHH